MSDWRDAALCAQTDPEVYYPEKGGSTKAAKRVCNGHPARGIEPCPVKEQCLAWAVETGERWGVWGGLSERERRKLRKDAA